MKSHAILIIDDDPAHILLCKRALKNKFTDITLLEANSLREGSAILHNNSNIEILLLDMNLGLESGLELLKELRASPKFSNLCIIMLSTSEIADDFERAYQMHANCYIYKSTDTNIFQNSVRSAVKFFLR